MYGTDRLSGVARLRSDGTLDTTFGEDGFARFAVSGSDVQLLDVQIDTEGRIVLSGSTTTGGEQRVAFARLSANGIADDTFGTGGLATTSVRGTARRMLVEESGFLVQREIVDGTNPIVSRFTAQPKLDKTYGSNGSRVIAFGVGVDVTAIGLGRTTNGRAAVGVGVSTSAGWRFGVAVLTAGGAFDATFRGDGRATFDTQFWDDSAALTTRPDGRILLAVAGPPGDELIALTHIQQRPSGAFDTSFGHRGWLLDRGTLRWATYNTGNVTSAVAVGLDGPVYVGGSYDDDDEGTSIELYRYAGGAS
jgi:uncharacterized delta-60 repeat protein